VSACGMPDAELLLRCKVIACQLITVLVRDCCCARNPTGGQCI
jgi:hypothetical protein